MEEKKKIKEIAKEQIRFRILFVVVTLVAAGMSILFLTQSNFLVNDQNIKPSGTLFSESFYGLIPDTETEINIVSADGKSYAYDTRYADENGTIQYVHIPEAGIIKKYTVNITLKKPNGSYLDISYKINGQDQKATAILSGFNPDTKVTFMTDKRESTYEEVPVDWSGKLELIASIVDTVAFCLTVEEETIFNVCHAPYSEVRT